MLSIERVVETAIYVLDLERAKFFYRDVLGLALHSEQAGRHVFFRVGPNSMLLLFFAPETQKGELLTPHGATGAGHVALGVPAHELDGWAEHLKGHGVEIELVMDWPLGGRSIYFRDPSGNSIELVTRGIWGLADGW